LPRRSLIIPTLALAAGLVGAALPVAPAMAATSPSSIDQRLHTARQTRAQALSAARLAERRYAALDAIYRRVQAQAEDAAADVVATIQQQRALSEELDSAQLTLDQKAAEAYMNGPGTAVELFLGSESPAAFASAQLYAARSLGVTGEIVAEVGRARTSLATVTAHLDRRRADLLTQARRLQALDEAMAEQVATARAEASRAGLAVRKLDAEQRALEEAAARDDAILDGLIDPANGVDQSALLALLGPTHGRGCTIPSGLHPTGEHRSGPASWYGADFAGKPTATGAIFDPRLFTAANKTLPLNEFLRVHYQGRCAIVLVNDRGPYGFGRRFDLAEAAATYLGYHSAGVVHVTTDVLVPRAPTP
jgi:rare lipoprotein A (peptidoglycan hydrolase)